MSGNDQQPDVYAFQKDGEWWAVAATARVAMYHGSEPFRAYWAIGGLSAEVRYPPGYHPRGRDRKLLRGGLVG